MSLNSFETLKTSKDGLKCLDERNWSSKSWGFGYHINGSIQLYITCRDGQQLIISKIDPSLVLLILLQHSIGFPHKNAFNFQATKREYKTLPRSFQEVRKSSDKKKESNSQASSHPTRVVSDANKIRHQDGHSNADGDHSAMYNFNVGLSNFISGGIHFLGNLGRRKSNNTSRSSSPPPRYDIYWL